MKNQPNESGLGCLLLVAAIVFPTILASGIGISWYRSGIQSEVYRREGIELSQWEVFCGAKPAERQINIKEKSK